MTELYGKIINKAGVRMQSCAEEFSLRPATPAHAADLFYDNTMAVSCKTRGDFAREWAHKALDEWFNQMRPPQE